MYFFDIISQLNIWAVLVSSIVYFFIGSLWFSPVLFSDIWIEELEKHNVKIKQPTSAQLTQKMLITLAANILSVLATGYLVIATNSGSLASIIFLGMVISIGFVMSSVGTVFNWENRSLKLFLIDIGYPIVGIISSAIILSLWR